MLGGLTSVPGAVVGGLLLGVGESFGAAYFGNTYRQMISFVVLILVLMFRPSGLFGERSALCDGPGLRRVLRDGPDVPDPAALAGRHRAGGAASPPLLLDEPYLYRVLTVALIFAILAMSLTLVAGQAGQISLGHAGFFGIGAYTSAILTTFHGFSPWVSAAAGGAAGRPDRRRHHLSRPAGARPLRRHRHPRDRPDRRLHAAELGVGDATARWGSPASRRSRSSASTSSGPASSTGWRWSSRRLVALLIWQLSRSHLGRSWRAIREDETAALTVAIRADHYKALAFGLSAAIAGLGGALIAHFYGYISYDSFLARESILALTMVVLGGMSSIPGAFVGSLALIGIPELFRPLADYRYILYGVPAAAGDPLPAARPDRGAVRWRHCWRFGGCGGTSAACRRWTASTCRWSRARS